MAPSPASCGPTAPIESEHPCRCPQRLHVFLFPSFCCCNSPSLTVVSLIGAGSSLTYRLGNVYITGRLSLLVLCTRINKFLHVYCALYSLKIKEIKYMKFINSHHISIKYSRCSERLFLYTEHRVTIQQMHQFNAPVPPGAARRDGGVVSYHSDPLQAKKYKKQNALSKTSKPFLHQVSKLYQQNTIDSEQKRAAKIYLHRYRSAMFSLPNVISRA